MELDFHLPKQMSPESDTETTDNAPPPLLRTHLSNALSLSATHKPHHHYNRPPNATSLAPIVSYKECLKNHAAKMGGLALDGCGEFMPSLDPSSSLKCAACGCHRNFHRRAQPPPTLPPPLLLWSPNSSSSGPNSPTTTSSPTPYSAAFPTKRARTKFTPEQKAKMHGFADRLGWRMARGPAEEKMLEEFCGEVGVRRNVFKVWMHNNKQRKGIIGNSEIDVNIKDEQQLAVERKVFGGSISSPSSS